MRILLLIAFLLLPAAAARAVKKEAPPLSEYDNVKPGLLALDTETPASGTEDEVPAEENAAETAPPGTMSLEAIAAAYQQGNFFAIVKSVTVLAENGQHYAEELLGLMYKSAQGVPKNPIKAVFWLNKAAEAKRPLAEHHLGVMYFMGEGVPVDHARALMWLRLAILHYPDGTEKNRALEDRDNLSAQTTRHNRDRGTELLHEWLEKNGEKHLLMADPDK